MIFNLFKKNKKENTTKEVVLLDKSDLIRFLINTDFEIMPSEALLDQACKEFSSLASARKFLKQELY